MGSPSKLIEVVRKAAAASAGGYATVQDEGVPLPQQTTINFIGGAVTAANDVPNNRTNVTVSAGAVAMTQVVVTLPYPASTFQQVTVVDASVSPSSKILLSLAGAADTATNGSDDLDLLSLMAVPQSGQFNTQWHFLVPQAGPITINYVTG